LIPFFSCSYTPRSFKERREYCTLLGVDGNPDAVSLHMVARLAWREQDMEGAIIAGVDPSRRTHEEKEDYVR
jgi:hypothetical protein